MYQSGENHSVLILAQRLNFIPKLMWTKNLSVQEIELDARHPRLYDSTLFWYRLYVYGPPNEHTVNLSQKSLIEYYKPIILDSDEI